MNEIEFPFFHHSWPENPEEGNLRSQPLSDLAECYLQRHGEHILPTLSQSSSFAKWLWGCLLTWQCRKDGHQSESS
jgi:hypothetical protein